MTPLPVLFVSHGAAVDTTRVVPEYPATLQAGAADAPAQEGGALTTRYHLDALIGTGGMGLTAVAEPGPFR